MLSFPEETEGDTEEPESRLSWLPAPLRKPLVTGHLITHLLANTAASVSQCVFGLLCLCSQALTSVVSLCLSNVSSHIYYMPDEHLSSSLYH